MNVSKDLKTVGFPITHLPKTDENVEMVRNLKKEQVIMVGEVAYHDPVTYQPVVVFGVIKNETLTFYSAILELMGET